MRPDVADVAEHKADEHEEKADQRERSGWADHLCEQADKKSTSVRLSFFTLKLRVKLLASWSTGGLLSSAGHKLIVSVHGFKSGDGSSYCAKGTAPTRHVCSLERDILPCFRTWSLYYGRKTRSCDEQDFSYNLLLHIRLKIKRQRSWEGFLIRTVVFLIRSMMWSQVACCCVVGQSLELIRGFAFERWQCPLVPKT